MRDTNETPAIDPRRFASRGAERQRKETQLRALMDRRGLDALLLRRVSSFAWATAGAPAYVSTTSDAGEAQLLVTRDASLLLTSDIEAPRLEHELGLAAQGWQFEVRPWAEAPNAALAARLEGHRLGVDGPAAVVGAAALAAASSVVDVSSDIARLRTTLTGDEIARFADLGERCAAAMAAATQAVAPGQTENAIAAHLAGELLRREVWPGVLQVASDARVLAYRHVLPTDKHLERYAFLSFCGRADGLVCSMTRLVHFGALSDDLRRRQEVAARVDAALLAATRTGAIARDVFAAAVAAYAAAGHPDEWRRHHQGGAAGYEPREWVATPTSDEVIGDAQAYAWNPSAQGTKSEDTVVLEGGAVRVLTTMPGWPTIDVGPLPRPAILEIT